MKSYDATTPIINQMIGQIIEPVAQSPLEVGDRTYSNIHQPFATPSYRLEKLLTQTAGKSTFLAIETHSHSEVVVEVLLFGPDFLAEAFNPLQQPASAAENQAPKASPYLSSFEIKTPWGNGLAMVQPYQNQISLPAGNHAETGNSQGDSLPTGSESPTSTSLATDPLTPEPYRMTLSAPHRRSTQHPQLSFADFKVRTTPEKLEIQFSQRRIREKFVNDNIAKPYLNDLELGLLTVVSTIIFVGGAVALSGSVLPGLIAATILPILLWFVASPLDKKTTPRRRAILRITTGPKNCALVSLTTFPLPNRRSTRHRSAWGKDIFPTESTLHFAQVPVSNIKLSTVLSLSGVSGLFCCQMSFLLLGRNAANAERLSITGTYSEIQWLRHHLVQWSNTRKKIAP